MPHVYNDQAVCVACGVRQAETVGLFCLSVECPLFTDDAVTAAHALTAARRRELEFLRHSYIPVLGTEPVDPLAHLSPADAETARRLNAALLIP